MARPDLSDLAQLLALAQTDSGAAAVVAGDTGRPTSPGCATMMITLAGALAKGAFVAEPEGLVTTFVSLYRQIHDQLRDEVSGLNKQALGWVPGPDTNSISTIVVHLLGSETEVLRIVRGLPSDRDRPSEFAAQLNDPQELLNHIEATDRLLEELGPQITDEDLATLRLRPSAVRNRTPKTGLFWLLNNYGHAREHLAHLQLTRQLLRQGPAPDVASSDLP